MGRSVAAYLGKALLALGRRGLSGKQNAGHVLSRHGLPDFKGDPGFEGEHVDFDVHVAAETDVAGFIDVEILFGDLVAEQFARRVCVQFERRELNRQGSADPEQ